MKFSTGRNSASVGLFSVSQWREIAFLKKSHFVFIIQMQCVFYKAETEYLYIIIIKKVKQSHYRPEQAQRVPGGWGSQISRQWVHEGGKVVSRTHRPPLPPRKHSWYSFLLEAESTPRAIVRPEGLCQWKIPMTPSGTEPATFWLVAQCLNQVRHRGPPIIIIIWMNLKLRDLMTLNKVQIGARKRSPAHLSGAPPCF